MTGGTTKIYQPPFCQQYDRTAVRKDELIYRGLMLTFLTLGYCISSSTDLIVKMPDIAYNGLIPHFPYVPHGSHRNFRLPLQNATFFEQFSSLRTSKPSIEACNAQIGSISVTMTRAP